MHTGKFRVGIVGCGAIARTHLSYLLRQRLGTVVGICDSDEGRLKTTADQFRITQRFTDFRAMLEQARPEVVHVLTPPGPSVGLATAAMKAGCHLLVEKPLALTPEDARLLVQTARDAGVKLCVDHSRLLHPCIQRARQYLESGKLGDLVAIEIVQGFKRSYPVAGIAGQRAPWSYTYPWGIYHNLMPHPLYIARAFAGQPTQIVAGAWNGARVPESAFDELVVDMTGATARARITLTLSTAPERNVIAFKGTKASLFVDTNLMTILLVRDIDLPSVIAKSVSVLDPAWQLFKSAIINGVGFAFGRIRSYPDIGETLKAFYSALEGRNPLPATGEDGLAVVEMMEAVRIQAESTLRRPAATLPTVSA